METEEKRPESDREQIGKLYALQVGLAVLQGVLNVRNGVVDYVEFKDRGVTLKVRSEPALRSVWVYEV